MTASENGTDLAVLDQLDPTFTPTGPAVRAARAAGSCARTRDGYAVLRHDALVALLADRRLVQGSHQLLTVQGVTEGPIVEWMNAILLSIEGADHARIRRLVSRAFTPRSVAALRPRMRAIAHDLVARFPAGRMELMGDFARPYAAEVLCELLGVPPGRRDAFRGWADDLGLAFSYQVRAHLERIEAALRGLNAAAEELIADRRADPGGGDLLSELVAAEEDGDRLSSAELRLLVSTLLFAGQDTTSHQLGHAVALLLDHSEHWDLIAGRPDGAERVVEEVLRVAPTVPATGRIALVDIDVDGIPVPAGTRMSMLLAAGNTDPATYGPDADAFDPTACRAVAPLTFGAGVHYCLGANLARAELAEALRALAALGTITADGAASWRPAMGITGPDNLPLRWSPRATS